MKEDIKKLIQSLQVEIKSAENIEDKTSALQRLQDIAKMYDGEDKVVSSHELVELIKQRPEQIKMFSGYGGLDSILDGFRHKQLVVISAATKSGKTSFCIELTSRLKEYNPMWLPFEEPAEELIIKFLDRKEQPPLFYTPQKMIGNTLSWVEKKIVEAKAKYNSQIVFIDHLHFIVDFGGQNMSQEIGKTMRELKQLAVKWGVVIVLIAHLRKTQVTEQPTLEDLRDSSFIAQEADTVIMLWRETGKDPETRQVIIGNNVNVSVQANRRTGKTGNVSMRFENGKFIENDLKYIETAKTISIQDVDKHW